jgi:hypothetical protein
MMRDGKMARIIEYADTALMESALDPLSEYEPKASAAGGTGEA